MLFPIWTAQLIIVLDPKGMNAVSSMIWWLMHLRVEVMSGHARTMMEMCSEWFLSSRYMRIQHILLTLPFGFKISFMWLLYWFREITQRVILGLHFLHLTSHFYLYDFRIWSLGLMSTSVLVCSIQFFNTLYYQN